MFRLDQQVERRKPTLHRIVCKNHRFGRTCGKTRIDDAAKKTLRCDNPRAAGADDFERRLHGLRSIGNRCNGLRTADFVDGFHTGKTCSNKRGGIDGTIRGRRGHNGKIRHASNHGRNGCHHGDGGKCALSARYIKRHRTDWREAVTSKGAGTHFLQPHRFRLLLFVKVADIIDAELDGFDHVFLDLVEGGIEFRFCRLDIGRVNFCLIQITRKPHQCGITLRANRFNNRLHFLDKPGKVGFRTFQKLRALGVVQLCQFVKGNIGHSRLLGCCVGGAAGHFDLRKMSSPTSRSSRKMANAAQAMKTTEIAARSGVMMDRIEL